ncbi:hypothetical protein CA54_46780 [Symmachiella macrocystis]|uniref:Uncharacterized protein n=1 Tax=Symmachiella macrocystis TaxID=2527985 RepID=A0A5C6BDS4_9PLAN|nr:hypothetical protein CA54_46780 [Symmachiella macrocystis]
MLGSGTAAAVVNFSCTEFVLLDPAKMPCSFPGTDVMLPPMAKLPPAAELRSVNAAAFNRIDLNCNLSLDTYFLAP